MKLLEKNEDFNLHVQSVDGEQVFIVASVTNESVDSIFVCKAMYHKIMALLLKHNIFILHERIFGSTLLYDSIRLIRHEIIVNNHIDPDSPFTFIDGRPYWGTGISGINIHGVLLKSEFDHISNIMVNNKICGRIWETRGFKYLMIHNIYSGQPNTMDSFNQTIDVYNIANDILFENGFKFGNVIRTWIYINNILKKYNEFNKARNLKFKDFGLIPNELDHESFEQIYMPASTGIGCNNVFEAPLIMDLLAIKKKDNSGLKIFNETGKKQKSAYRYGSAFSRSMVIEYGLDSKYIYLSGTASINDNGETVFINDIRNQIEMTGNVIKELVKKENFDFTDICEGTVFLKKPEYISEFKEYCHKNGLLDVPFIITLADVCRDDLLFEIDATLAGTDVTLA